MSRIHDGGSDPRLSTAEVAERHRGMKAWNIAIAGIIAAIIAMLAWSWLVRTVVIPAWLQGVGSYAVVWVPLGVAVFVAARSAARRPGAPLLPRPLFRPIDLLWGFGVGLMLRGVAAGIELAILGRMSGSGLQLEIDPAMAWFTLILAPLVIAPIIEELFFRGLTLSSLQQAAEASRPRRTSVTVSAVIVSSLLFAALHTIESTSPTLALVTGLSTFAFGLAAALLVVFTKRLGGAMIAHVVFNGMLILMIVS